MKNMMVQQVLEDITKRAESWQEKKLWEKWKSLETVC